jgi:hypothetical protein
MRSVHRSIDGFQGRIPFKETFRGANEMLCERWLDYQPFDACDDVSTARFDRALVIVIPSYNLERVLFPLPESLIIW